MYVWDADHPPTLKNNPSTINFSKAQLGSENQLSAGYMTYFLVCITPMNLLNLGFPNWDVKHPNTPQTIPYLKDPYNQSHRYVVVNFRSRFVCSRRQLNDHPNDHAIFLKYGWCIGTHPQHPQCSIFCCIREPRWFIAPMPWLISPVLLEEVGTFLELAGNGDLKLKCKPSGEVKTFKKGGPVGFCLKMLGT